jgi:hypothetical protein
MTVGLMSREHRGLSGHVFLSPLSRTSPSDQLYTPVGGARAAD